MTDACGSTAKTRVAQLYGDLRRATDLVFIGIVRGRVKEARWDTMSGVLGENPHFDGLEG